MIRVLTAVALALGLGLVGTARPASAATTFYAGRCNATISFPTSSQAKAKASSAKGECEAISIKAYGVPRSGSCPSPCSATVANGRNGATKTMWWPAYNQYVISYIFDPAWRVGYAWVVIIDRNGITQCYEYDYPSGPTHRGC